MIPMGSLGDRLGRKRVLLAGLALFGAASAACALADSPGVLIAARAVQGIGGAAMMPLSMAMLPVLFQDPEERTRAMNIWVTSSALGLPLGPIVGGYLLAHYSWGWVFLINVPLVVVGLVALAVCLPESRSARTQRVDLPGIALSSTGLVALIYGLIEAGRDGWGSASVLAPIAAGVVVLAGFLVWELKENWKLYRANRAKEVKPIAIGHHGETFVALLRPGFHSGTIPKLYTKLRRAAWSDDERAVAKHKEALHHVEEAIWKFAERELVAMLNEAPQFPATDVAVGRIEIGSNRVGVELVCASIGAAPLNIRFEQQSGWIVVNIADAGWVDRLADAPRRVFEMSLAGFYKLAGVDIVREQLEIALAGPNGVSPYDISDEGIVVWPAGSYHAEVIYDLRSSNLTPKTRGIEIGNLPPSLAGPRVIFSRVPLRWSTWTTAWLQLGRGEEPVPVVIGPSILPVQGVPRRAASVPGAIAG